MKTSLRTLLAACGLGVAGLMTTPVAMAQAPSTSAAPAADAATSGPTITAAVRVPHASKATMLASARAGARIVAVGDHGVVLLSDDGGRTHRQARSVPVDVALTSVVFIDANKGWAVGHWGVVLQTEDGGETWRIQRTDTQVDRPLFAVHFFDASNGVAVGLWSLVLTTSDGGASWQERQVPKPEGAKKADLNLLGLFADRRGRVFAAAEKGMVYRSDDRGQQWSPMNTGYKGSFWTGVATADGALLVAGLRGSMYRSADDGRNWVRIETDSRSSVTALGLAGDEVIGVGLDGLVLRSDDGGATFVTSIRPDRLSLTTWVADAQGRPVFYSRQGVVAADAVADVASAPHAMPAATAASRAAAAASH